MKKPLVGFIGQGWIGKHYADDFEKRKYKVVRYALEQPYAKNKDAIALCDIVYIAVPTPTTPRGFSYGVVEKVLSLVGKGKIAVIKSTLLPGTTEKLAKQFKGVIVLHSPEFLTEATAAYDAAHPLRNIVGIPANTARNLKAANQVLATLPKAPYTRVMSARSAELVKYGGNCYFYEKVVFMNMLYDLSLKLGADWETVREALVHDPRIAPSHTQVTHKSGRGAGGHCFIKDFEAFRRLYAEFFPADKPGRKILDFTKIKNVELLRTSGKDLDLLREVYF